MDETLTVSTAGIADADGPADPKFSYQWIRNNGGADTDISGNTTAGYTVVAKDVGKTLKVRVSFTNDAGNDEMLTSVPVGSALAGQSAPGGPIRLELQRHIHHAGDLEPDN